MPRALSKKDAAALEAFVEKCCEDVGRGGDARAVRAVVGALRDAGRDTMRRLEDFGESDAMAAGVPLRLAVAMRRRIAGQAVELETSPSVETETAAEPARTTATSVAEAEADGGSENENVGENDDDAIDERTSSSNAFDVKRHQRDSNDDAFDVRRAFGKMPRSTRPDPSRGNVAGTRVTRRRERSRRGRDDANVSSHSRAYRLRDSELSDELRAEFVKFRRFLTTRRLGSHEAPIKEVTARKYEDHVRGLLGWMLFTFPEEFPRRREERSFDAPRVSLPRQKLGGARVRAPAVALGDAPLRPRVRARRAPRVRRRRQVPARRRGGGRGARRRPAVRARASRHAAAAAEQGCGSARVPSLAGGGRAQEVAVVGPVPGARQAAGRRSRAAVARGRDENRRGGGVEPAAVSDLRRLVVRAGPATHDPRAGDRAHAVQRTQGGWWHERKRFVAGTKRALHALVTERRRFRGNPRASFAERRGADRWIDLRTDATEADYDYRWVIKHGPEDYKTGRNYGERPPMVLAPSLYGALEEWIERRRAHLAPRHANLFTARNGAPLTDVGVHSLLTSTSYRLTGRRVNPHLVRDMIITHLRGTDASERQLEALAIYMGHSLAMQKGTYDRRSKAEKVAPAVQLLSSLNVGLGLG